MTYFIRGVNAEQVPMFWKHGEAFIKRALDHANGELTHEDIRTACERRDMQLWMIATKDAVVGALSTEIVQYPQKRMVRVVTVAGKGFEEWAGEMNKILDEWGRAQGCKGIEAYVRSGFVKKLAHYGYVKKYEMVSKEINGGQK